MPISVIYVSRVSTGATCRHLPPVLPPRTLNCVFLSDAINYSQRYLNAIKLETTMAMPRGLPASVSSERSVTSKAPAFVLARFWHRGGPANLSLMAIRVVWVSLPWLGSVQVDVFKGKNSHYNGRSNRFRCVGFDAHLLLAGRLKVLYFGALSSHLPHFMTVIMASIDKSASAWRLSSWK